MAITTLAGVRSGLQPPVYFTKSLLAFQNSNASVWSSTWGTSGNPLAGAFDTTLNGVTLTAPVTGALNFLNAPSGNAYLARFQYACLQLASTFGCNPMMWLCDRLWHNGGYTITSTSPQSSTTPTWPARDENGSTNGVGVFLGLEISSSVGAGTPNISVSYTNSSGVSGRTAAGLRTAAASVGAGTFWPLTLQAGDVGVQSVQSLTLSASWVSGTMNLVAFRPISILSPRQGISAAVDAITGALPLIWPNSVLFFAGMANMANSGSPPAMTGNIQYTFG